MGGQKTGVFGIVSSWFFFFFGRLTLEDWAFISTIFASLAGLFITYYFKKKQDKRDAIRLEEMKKLNERFENKYK